MTLTIKRLYNYARCIRPPNDEIPVLHARTDIFIKNHSTQPPINLIPTNFNETQSSDNSLQLSQLCKKKSDLHKLSDNWPVILEETWLFIYHRNVVNFPAKKNSNRIKLLARIKCVTTHKSASRPQHTKLRHTNLRSWRCQHFAIRYADVFQTFKSAAPKHFSKK